MNLEINYNSGSLTIDLDQVASTKGLIFTGFSQVKFKKLLKVVDLASNSEDLARQIINHLSNQLGDLPKDLSCRKKIIKLIEITKEHFNLKEEKAMTKTTYFAAVKTLEELRTVYKNLLKANHPDNGGSVETMQEINAQYDEAFKLLKSGATIESEADTRKWSDVEDANIREALSKVVGYAGVNIEIVGCWIWVDGNTFAIKDILKDAGYKWSQSRKKWHYSPYESKWHKGGKKTFDQLRQKYGSMEVEGQKVLAS